MAHRPVPAILAISSAFLLPAGARAADTIETWAPGSVDAEAHIGAPTRDARPLQTSTVAGYGIARGFSGYFELDGNRSRTGATHQFHSGLFGTPLDTDHLDLDLLLDVAFDGWRPTPAPGFELNLDSSADGSGAGAYLRLTGVPSDPCAATLGFYTRVVEGQQLFLEHTGGLAWTSLAVGYNWVLRDNLEFVTQISTDLRTGGFGSQLGVIITLPALSSSAVSWSSPSAGWDWTGSRSGSTR